MTPALSVPAEITRVTAVKTFGLIAAAKLDVQLTTPCTGGTNVLQCAVTELCSFLRKSNRPLRQASLTTLDELVANHAANISDADLVTTVGLIALSLEPLPSAARTCHMPPLSLMRFHSILNVRHVPLRVTNRSPSSRRS